MSERRPMKIMLDSGAYSAWGKETLDLGAYIQFIKRYRKLLDTYINLDVIPGERGTRASVREVERAAAASLDNYLAMRAAGLDPIPVFHYGESFQWLDKLLDSGAKYICLGGTVGVAEGPKIKFLDECFSALTTSSGAPIVRVHGLGIWSSTLLRRYPWHSADSTAWILGANYGEIAIPTSTRGFILVNMSAGRIGGSKYSWSKRLADLSDSEFQAIESFAESLGVTITDLRYDTYSRALVFARSLVQMEEQVPTIFAYHRGTFASYKRPSTRVPTELDFRMVFAGNLAKHHQEVLYRCGARYHLRSYYEHYRDPDSFVRYHEALNDVTLYDVGGWLTPKTNWQSLNYHDYRRRLLAARADSEDVHGAEAAT